MDAMLPLLHAVSAAAAAALVMGVAEGLALTACVAAVLRLCPGLSAGVRSAVWTAALWMSVLLPVGSLVRSSGGAAAPRGVAEVGEGWALGLVGVWAVLSAARLAMLVVSAVRLREVWRRARPVEASAGFGELLRAGGRAAELCVSEDVDRPSVVGFLRPRVLLPAALLEELGPEEMEHIVRHEMEHLERRDDWTNLLQKVSLAVFPLNPVLFWLDRRLCRERELACDDGVLRQTRARKAYAACLASLAANRMAGRGSALALGALGRESELSRRVHRILNWRESGMGRRSAVALAGVLMLGVAGGGTELARCPELLRFTDGAATLAEVAGPAVRPGATEFAASAGVGAGSDVPVLAGANGSGVRPMLLRAVMLGSRAVSGRATEKRHRLTRTGAAGVRRVRQAPQRRLSEVVTAPQTMSAPQRMSASRVVMTAWPEAEFPARLVLAVADDGQPRYAAFATRDGWLVLSL